ncbi:MAG: ribonuclease III [Saprospiraceae bacterium]|nr:ribonuclease III [Saprospiraceae bacterium]
MFRFFKLFARIYNRLFSQEKVFIKRLRNLIGFTPANLGIFKLAFYHKSTTSDKLYAIQSNERLEYLGDAVLATIVAEYLFQKYPNSDEGFLTKMRSKIVKRHSLNVIADKMGLDVFLNQYNNTRLSKSMLGNALEALVGAVYLEKGYNATRRFVINKILLGYLDIHELENFDDNYKSQLLEWCQKNGKTVSYKMVSKYKFEKRDRFKVAVLVDGEKIAVADDFNKKSAEQTASEKALKNFGILQKPEDDKQQRKGDKFKRKHDRDRPKRDNKRRSNPRSRQEGDSGRKGNRNQPRNKQKSNQSSSDTRSSSKRPNENQKNRRSENPQNTRNHQGQNKGGGRRNQSSNRPQNQNRPEKKETKSPDSERASEKILN